MVRASAKADKLKNARSVCESKIEYFKNKLPELKTVGEFESILNRLRSTYTTFEIVQSQLEEIDEDFFSFRDKFEDKYGAVESCILNAIADFKLNPNADSKESGTTLSFKIPDLPLPKFDGDDENWLNFRGIFDDLIHTNPKYNNIVKFHYLISCVRDGKAYKHIQPFPLSDENYEVAYKQLFDYYNNEIKIQKIHVKRLYDIKRPVENSAPSLQLFLDTATKHYNALKSLKVPVEHWDLFLSHHLCEKLDDSSKSEIITKSSPTELLSFEKFVEILQTHIRILEAKKSFVKAPSNSQSTRAKPAPTQSRVLFEQNSNCPFCKGDHFLDLCPKFNGGNMKPHSRFKFVKRNGICVSCLRDTHDRETCPSVCSICSKGHHNLLHFSRAEKNSNTSKSGNNNANTSNSNKVELIPSAPTDTSSQQSNFPQASQNFTTEVQTDNQIDNNVTFSQILLATVVLWVHNSKGNLVPCRALLDSGSQANFLSQNMCNKLGLKVQPTNVNIVGINGDVKNVNKEVTLRIESQKSDYRTSVKCLIKSSLAGIIPLQPLRIDIQKIPHRDKLADPWFFKPEAIDLLLGVELFAEIMKPEKLNIDGLPCQNSVFGLVVMGRVFDSPQIKSVPELSTYSVSFQDLNDDIQKFWKIENIDYPNEYSLEEKSCERHYAQTVDRDKSGRYIVSLPIKENIENLGDSSRNAMRQFYSLENRLNKKPEIKSQYIQFMNEYESLHQMEEVSNPEQSLCPSGKMYYMPHHSVIRESSSTTKLRVVFNASHKTPTGTSLNDCLMVGPTIQQDLCSILLRFRKHLIGITGDIAKMYRQILVQPNQQDLQRIWWRENPQSPLKSYRLKTVTYGTASAPFLAIRTLFQLAADEQHDFPVECYVLKNDFYVDDVLTGADSIEKALSLKTNLVDLLSRGGFELRKITSNNPLLRSDDSSSQCKPISILGITWDTISDIFNFSFKNYSLDNPCTKRIVLSEIAQLFDPLGFCGPIILLAKLFMQRLWSLKLEWDDVLPPELCDYWIDFKTQLMSLGQLSFPRCITTPDPVSIELHGFGDASEKGFGCCIYIRTIDRDQNCQIRLLCSKNRVAPLKTLTIPRLELSASLLLAELTQKVLQIMDIQFSDIFLWTDSEITLYRIRSAPSRFTPFVANRISRIQDLTCTENWYYVPTSENPADLNSRGVKPSDFLNFEMWFQGPSFLMSPKDRWPVQPANILIEPDRLELRKTEISLSARVEEWDAVSNSSNILKIIRRFAMISKFIQNLKDAVKMRRTDPQPAPQKSIQSTSPFNVWTLTPLELDLSLKLIVRHIQNIEYSDEIACLRKGKILPRKSKLISLTPFLDTAGILRVGGRLKNANIHDDYKHQMLLPSSHSFTKLLVRFEHKRLLHAGPQTLLYNVRERFWIICGRNLCKLVVRQCIRCIRSRPQTYSQIMGQLPSDRVDESWPFERTGIDFCGPFFIVNKIKSRVVEKVYVSVFICFTTKAVHMELVGDLSTPAFIAALHRFTSRRGYCRKIHSDNATNFVGAKAELKELHDLFQSQLHKDEVLRFCKTKNISWHTIPPRSPHFGGLWEAAVKSAKFHLKRVVGNDTYTFDQLYTLVTEIEACLNSRPLGPMSEDPNDLSCLTPGHFLIGRPLVSLPDPSLKHLSFNKLSHFQKIQAMRQNFWDRWSREYLGELQQRRKWQNVQPEPKVNDLVILVEENTPPLTWPLARIVELHRGRDGYVRVVSVKMRDKIFKRAIQKVCPLISEKDSESDSSS